MKAHHWSALPARIQDGRVRRVVAGERLTILRQTIPAGVPLSGLHRHPQEQVTIVLEGTARFTCEGEEVTLGPGGVVVFPPEAEHSTENAGEGDLVLEEVFAPGVEWLNRLSP